MSRPATQTTLDVLVASIQTGGGEVDAAQISALLNPTASKIPQERIWLSPGQVELKYRHVWVARTKSGKVAQVIILSHRRTRGAGRRVRRWYGVNLTSGREVQITSVLKGSEI